jgi:hypothetical protein
MFGTDRCALSLGSGYKGPSGQMIGFPEKACRSLIDGRDRSFLENVALYSCKL